MTRSTRSTALPALALLAGLAACGAGDAPGPGRDAGENAPAAARGGAADVPAPAPSAMTAAEDPGAPAPEAKTGTIAVAGGTAEISFKRFDAPAGFPLQFATYVPEDMIVETTTAAGGRDAVRVVANFGGTRDDNAFLWALFQPPGTDEATARRAAQEAASARGAAEALPERARRFPWSIAEYEFRYQPATGRTHAGRIALGHRGERFFHVVIEYPEELAGEFVPRVNRILEDWRWKSGGARIGDARTR